MHQTNGLEVKVEDDAKMAEQTKSVQEEGSGPQAGPRGHRHRGLGRSVHEPGEPREQRAGLRQRSLVRIVGLSGQRKFNGLEGRVGRYDADKGRWAVPVGSPQAMAIKPDNLELVGRDTTKDALRRRFVDLAMRFGCDEPMLSCHVFDRLRDQTVGELGGANLRFEQLEGMGPDFFLQVYERTCG